MIPRYRANDLWEISEAIEWCCAKTGKEARYPACPEGSLLRIDGYDESEEVEHAEEIAA